MVKIFMVNFFGCLLGRYPLQRSSFCRSCPAQRRIPVRSGVVEGSESSDQRPHRQSVAVSCGAWLRCWSRSSSKPVECRHVVDGSRRALTQSVVVHSSRLISSLFALELPPLFGQGVLAATEASAAQELHHMRLAGD